MGALPSSNSELKGYDDLDALLVRLIRNTTGDDALSLSVNLLIYII